MTVTLCIETSSAYCSLALSVEDQVFHRHERLQRRHNEEVLPLLDSLYREAGMRPRDTQLIGFGAGPGSFTGVRIAASIAQGLAMASDCPVVAMAGSEVLLRSALDLSLQSQPAQNLPACWLTVVPSRADAFYLGLYRVENSDDCSELIPEQVERLYTQVPDWLTHQLDRDPNLGLAGPRPSWLAASVRFQTEVDLEPNARMMTAAVRRAHESGNSVAAQAALPIYVDGDSPWNKVPAAANKP
jgi:tRNA threonylcarbamoyladenosine biosynthesis protein TsaB